MPEPNRSKLLLLAKRLRCMDRVVSIFQARVMMLGSFCLCLADANGLLHALGDDAWNQGAGAVARDQCTARNTARR